MSDRRMLSSGSVSENASRAQSMSDEAPSNRICASVASSDTACGDAVRAEAVAPWFDVAPLVPQSNSRLYLLIEFVALFVGLPLLLFTQRHTLEGMIAPTLLLLAAGCTLLLWHDRAFDRTRLWNRQRFKRRVARAIMIFIPGAATVVVALGVLRPDLLLTFPQTYPKVWIAIMVTYPFVSVYPQEVIFRAFLFHRYDALFPGNWAKIVASGAAFGLAHIVFANWVAPLMTAASGVWFARTYSRTESTLQVSIEHGIWGCFAFTIGLGWYVYSGAIG